MRALVTGAIGLLISAASLGIVAGPTVHQYPVPSAGGSVQIASGGGTVLVFPEPNANAIGQLSVDGDFTQRRLPNTGSRPLAIAPESDPLQRIVFTEPGSNRIGVIDSAGNPTEYDVPTPGSDPRGVVAPGLIWFTEYGGNAIGRLDTSGSGSIVEFPLPTANAGPLGIATSSSGDVWFTEFLANKIGRIDANGVITEYAIPTPDSGPTAIVEAADGSGNLYFTESKANKIGRITDAGVVTEFPVPTPGSGLSDIVADFDGVWFSERFAGRLGRLSFDGTFAEFPLPGSRPDGIAITSQSSDGSEAPRSVWWIDGTNKIVGRLSENRIYAVGAGHDPTFDTEFDLSSASGQPLRVRLGTRPQGVCPAICPFSSILVDVPGSGTVTRLASDIPQTEGIELYTITGEDFAGIVELPATEAFLIDEGDGSRAELPLVDYWTMADSQPPATGVNRQPSLTFPARRRAGTAHTDLIVADIESSGALSVRIDAVREGVGIVATTTRSFTDTLVMKNVLTTLGIFNDFEGHIVVTRQSFSGLFWGLTEITDGNRLILAEPGSEIDDGGCTAGPARCNLPRQTRVVTRD